MNAGHSSCIGSATTASSLSILYAEDDSELRNLFGNVLLKVGYRVEVVDDGQAGWEALRRGGHDLLITDYDMPGLTGLGLIERLRVAGHTMPVILASGSGGSGFHFDPWLQVSAILKKPFTPFDLLETVKQVLLAAASQRTKGEVFFPVLATALSQVRPARHFGIND